MSWNTIGSKYFYPIRTNLCILISFLNLLFYQYFPLQKKYKRVYKEHFDHFLKLHDVLVIIVGI